MNKLGLAAALVGLVSLSAPANAANLVLNGTELIGATGLDVGGVLYDVTFQDGTCQALFSGCNDASDFTFQTPEAAEVAVKALIDQVFIDGLHGQFDSVPALTAGCENEIWCGILVPSEAVASAPIGGGPAVSGMQVTNYALNGGYTSFFIGRTTNTTGIDFVTWARFTPSSTAPVPEPATWALMILGFGAIGGALRSRRRQPGRLRTA